MEYLGVIILFALIVLGVGLFVAIMFLLTLSKTLRAVAPQNRTMQPDQVWLLLIPLFNLYWIFVVVSKLSESIRNEFVSRGLSIEERPTYNLGLAYAIVTVVNGIFSVSFNFGSSFTSNPFSGMLSLAALILIIAYWVTVNNYKKRLESLPPADFADSMIFGK